MPTPGAPTPKALAEELERVRLLYRIGRLIDPASDSRKILHAILREAVRAMRATSGSLVLIDQARGLLNIEVAVGIDPEAWRALVLRVGEGVTGHVAKTGKPLRVNDVNRSRHYVRLREGVASEMAVPLIVDGRAIGVLNVDADRPNAFSADDESLLAAAAEEAARVIQISRLHEQIRHQAAKLETLYRVGQTITTAPRLEEVLNRIAAEVRSAMNAKVCSILLLDETGEELSIQATAGASQEYTKRSALRVRDTLVGQVALTGKPLAVRDVRRAPGFRQAALARREGLCSLLCVPIHFLDRPIGVLNIYTGEPTDFGDAETHLLTALAGQSAVAIENARRMARIAETEEQLRQAEKLSALGALAAEIAHEIRNPITIIQMLMESLAADVAEGDPRRKDVAVINAKLSQINRIVEQVLDVARAREERFAPFDVHDAIEDALFLTQRRLAASGVELRRRYTRDLPRVHGDRIEIEQVLLNLILNACQAMPDGGRLTISTRLKERDNEPRVAIRVADTGPGIPRSRLDRIFAPFYTTRPDGVGMGLFVARKVMAAHRGELTVEGRPGEGAVFEAALPVAGGNG
ncbi:MAG: GAF domain-containing protein [Candidatus Sumerlaeota bacterium]|nr:GAF domain-containing protein [Candidatus Sumerlaeota bacterium]